MCLKAPLWIEGRSLGHRPRLENTVYFQTEVVVEAAGGMLLDDEKEGTMPSLRWLGELLAGQLEVPLVAVDLEHSIPLIPTSRPLSPGLRLDPSGIPNFDIRIDTVSRGWVIYMIIRKGAHRGQAV